MLPLEDEVEEGGKWTNDSPGGGPCVLEGVELNPGGPGREGVEPKPGGKDGVGVAGAGAGDGDGGTDGELPPSKIWNIGSRKVLVEKAYDIAASIGR